MSVKRLPSDWEDIPCMPEMTEPFDVKVHAMLLQPSHRVRVRDRDRDRDRVRDRDRDRDRQRCTHRSRVEDQWAVSCTHSRCRLMIRHTH